MIPVRFVERIGADCTAELGWEVMPEAPRVGDTVRLRDRPDDLAATVMGIEWMYGSLPYTERFVRPGVPEWHAVVWVHTGDADSFRDGVGG